MSFENLGMQLREEVLGSRLSLAESKNGQSWWDGLTTGKRKKVVSILGMSKGKEKKLFDDLDADEQSEIKAYYQKHKGKVESELHSDEDELQEGARNWWAPGNEWLIKKATAEYRAQLASHLKKRRSKKTFRYSPPDWQQDAIEALGKNDEEWFKGIKLANL